MIKFEMFGPHVVDLIKAAETKFDNGSDRHDWVVDQVLALDFWPRYVPRSIRRALAKWLVELIFQSVAKGLDALADKLGDKLDARDPDEPVPGDRIVPERLAASNPDQLLALRVPAIKKALKTGRFDDRLDEIESVELAGANRRGVIKAIAERR